MRESNRKVTRSYKNKPCCKRYQRNSNDNRYKDTSNAVSKTLNRCFGACCLINQANDACKRCIIANSGGTHLKPAAGRYRCACHGIANGLTYRNGLSGNRGLIDRSFSFDELAINRNRLSRPYHKHVSHHNGLCRNFLFNTVFDENSRLWSKVHKCANCACGMTLCARLKELAQGNQSKNHTCGLKVHAVHCLVSCSNISCNKSICHLVQANNTVSKRRC